MDPAALASIAAIITALLTGVAAILATRTRVKVDDVDQLRSDLRTARAERDAEIARREADRETYVTRAEADRAAMEERHRAELVAYDRRIATLEVQLVERDKRITKLDKAIMAARGYVARLIAQVLERGGTVPPRPSEMDE